MLIAHLCYLLEKFFWNKAIVLEVKSKDVANSCKQVSVISRNRASLYKIRSQSNLHQTVTEILS